MKKLLFFSIIALVTIPIVYAGDVVTLDESKLPEKAQLFLNRHLSDYHISYIKIESKFLKGKKYEVVFTNGVDIEFDGSGDWKEIDFQKQQIPDELIPQYVKEYVKLKFSNQYVTKMEKNSKGLEVELNNDLSLKFNKKGDFIKLDD